MKTLKITALAAVVALGISCGNDSKKTSVDQHEQGTLPEIKNDSTAPADTLGGAATPETNTPAWAGNYSGSLPCATARAY